MKVIVCLLFMLVSAKECDKKADALKDTSSEKSELRMSQQTMKITYRASTRGFFEVIEITNDSISFTNDYNLKDFKTFAISKEGKETLYNLVSQLELSELKDLKPPSKTHQYDAAPAAFLKVENGEDIYMTPTFDHGKPPKTISNLVEKILAVKSLFEEQ